MNKIGLIAALLSCNLICYGQDINITFSATGDVSRIYSVKATNLSTGSSITLPGSETLILTKNSGIPATREVHTAGLVFPNPFSGRATFIAVSEVPQTVFVNIINLFGQVIAKAEARVQSGGNRFTLDIARPGIYFVNLTADQVTSSYKVICTGISGSENSIRYLGAAPVPDLAFSQSVIKSTQSGYSLGYTPGDVILYKASSALYTSIVADSPDNSMNYLIDFVACTDREGRNYSTVKIWDNFWMAENLAWLPKVSPSTEQSDIDPCYYVYGYENTSVTDAKTTSNYSTYGVLYNFKAALTACPGGWQLSTDQDWTLLEYAMGMNDSVVRELGYRRSGAVGAKIKETGDFHWTSPNIGATNFSGFTALPSGRRSFGGGFDDLGNNAAFWAYDDRWGNNSWERQLHNLDIGIYRGYSEYPQSGFSVRCVKFDNYLRPKLNTIEANDISGTSASSGGYFSRVGIDSITARGICWAVKSNPTLADNKTLDGSGSGTFTSRLTGLHPNTQYFVRAYVVHMGETIYGSQVNFTTSPEFGSGSIEYQNRTSKLNQGYNVWFSEVDCGNFDVFAYGIYLTDGIEVFKYSDGGMSLLSIGKGSIFCFNLFSKSPELSTGIYTFIDSVNCNEYYSGNQVFTIGPADKLVACAGDINDPTYAALDVDLSFDWESIMAGVELTTEDLLKYEDYLNKSIFFRSGLLTISKAGNIYIINIDCITTNGDPVIVHYEGPLNFIEFGI